MAKESIKARQRKRERMVAQYATKREALKKAGDFEGLQKLPRNSSPVRLKNRCKLTGRPKGYMRDFGICRNQFRELALMGKIPGVTKASW
ncbi:MAG: 30S ribosomal protein S14 [Bacteroidia bacterium]|nr:30S ribosomal protein S14 [Bacteroidia bacterium]MCF8427807.1 30S ribosomal protein S14 [Bacteroidia bacterium]MCF8446045.1 30S ribosomal protein S14 [Bacteroidia bacterium]